MPKRTPQLDIAPNTVADEAKQIAIKWISTFGSNCGSIDSDSFLWHVFSGDCYPCLSGEGSSGGLCEGGSGLLLGPVKLQKFSLSYYRASNPML